MAEISTNTTEVQKTSDRMQLRIERVVFDKNIDWRFTDLASPIHSFQAAMEDTAFLDSVRAGGERFGNGDTIQATVRRTEVVKPEREFKRAVRYRGSARSQARSQTIELSRRVGVLALRPSATRRAYDDCP